MVLPPLILLSLLLLLFAVHGARCTVHAGYSSLTQLNATHLGLLWETTTPECVNIGRGRPPWPSYGAKTGGQGSSACKTRFTAVALAVLGPPCSGSSSPR